MSGIESFPPSPFPAVNRHLISLRGLTVSLTLLSNDYFAEFLSPLPFSERSLRSRGWKRRKRPILVPLVASSSLTTIDSICLPPLSHVSYFVLTFRTWPSAKCTCAPRKVSRPFVYESPDFPKSPIHGSIRRGKVLKYRSIDNVEGFGEWQVPEITGDRFELISQLLASRSFTGNERIPPSGFIQHFCGGVSRCIPVVSSLLARSKWQAKWRALHDLKMVSTGQEMLAGRKYNRVSRAKESRTIREAPLLSLRVSFPRVSPSNILFLEYFLRF